MESALVLTTAGSRRLFITRGEGGGNAAGIRLEYAVGIRRKYVRHAVGISRVRPEYAQHAHCIRKSHAMDALNSLLIH